MTAPRAVPGPRLLPALLAAVLLTGCIAPRAARLPPVTAPGFTMERDEKGLWREAAELEARARKSGAVLADPALEKYLLGVARKLTPRAAQQQLDVRVRIVESAALTAFVTPDGCVFVSMGLLARLDDEAELAMVMGHELVHAINRHSIVEYRTYKSGAALGSILPFSLGELGTMAAVTGYSRDLETEADAEGLGLLVAGGWDPREAPRPFQHLAAWVKEEKLDEPFFFSTHPRLEERIESVTRLLQTRYADRRGGEVGAARYRGAVREVVLGAARLDLEAGRFDAAERGARDYLELSPRSAPAWALLGDVARQRGDANEALARYRKAVALDPACAEAQRGLGQALARRGDHAAARAALSAYLRLRPDAVDKAWIDAELERLPRSGR